MVKAARPTRADYYRALADSLPPQALVVTSLGNASYLWAALHHAPENFYF
jgi:sulfopyruvate decarboxylase subunit beta